MTKICIIGAGVIGLSVGIRLVETFPNTTVIIYSENVTPYTTSDVAAGLWYPYAIGTNEEDIKKWCLITHAFLKKMVLEDPNHHKYGIFLQDLYTLSDSEIKMNFVHKIFWNTRILNEHELNMFGSHKFGIAATSFMSQAIKLMPYLMERFLSQGGIIVRKRVQSFDEIQAKEKNTIIINCSGLGARDMCNDNEIYPLRGQIVKVDAPWVKYAIQYKEFYILPQSDGTVILGGTAQKNNFNLIPNETDTANILNGCFQLLPGLKECKIVDIKVGLRPYRSTVRVEKENKINKETGEKYVLIHNYGHGGSGLTLFWGCAESVMELVKTSLIQAGI